MSSRNPTLDGIHLLKKIARMHLSRFAVQHVIRCGIISKRFEIQGSVHWSVTAEGSCAETLAFSFQKII